MQSKSVQTRTLLCVAVGFFYTLCVKVLPGIGTDEVEHFHFAFQVYLGKAPYIDFFEHHLPLTWHFVSLFLFPASVGSKVLMVRLLQAILITLSAFLFSRSFKNHPNFVFGVFVIALTLPNPTINYADLRPEFFAIFFLSFTIYLLRNNSLTNKDIFLLGLVISLGTLFTPRFLPVSVIIFAYSIYNHRKQAGFHIVGILIPVIGFFSFFNITDVYFFVFELTSSMPKTFAALFSDSAKSVFFGYFVVVLVLSFFLLNKGNYHYVFLYWLLFGFVFIEKKPFINQSTVLMFLVSLKITLENVPFIIVRYRYAMLSFLILLSVSVKARYILLQKHLTLWEDLEIRKDLLKNCKDDRVLVSFHDQNINDKRILHPIFVDNKLYFGFVQKSILTEDNIRSISEKNNNNLSALPGEGEFCILDQDFYNRLKSAIN